MASSTSSSCSQAPLKSFPSVLVSNDLMQLIKDPGEEKGEKNKAPFHTSHLTTMDELLMNLKNYILKYKLYDEKDPLKILVGENALGSLLGKNEFSLLDVRDLLFERFVFPVEDKNSSEVICSISDKMCLSKKRKQDNDSEFSAKRIKGLDDTKSYCDSDESMYSAQNYETEFVKDSTSDDNLSVGPGGFIIAETFDVDVEYEIETDSEGECFSYESDSDLEDFVKSAIISYIVHQTDSDIEYLADRSSDDEESEKELSEEDKWACLSCNMLNSPVMRHCQRCWQAWSFERSESQNEKIQGKSTRKEFARRKRKKSNKNKESSCKGNSDVKLSDLPSATAETSPSTSFNDSSDVSLSQSSSNTLEVDKSNIKIELDKQLCLFCCTRPADCSILHGKVACHCTCFKCGQKLFAENKRCPICRRKIERIVLNRTHSFE